MVKTVGKLSRRLVFETFEPCYFMSMTALITFLSPYVLIVSDDDDDEIAYFTVR